MKIFIYFLGVIWFWVSAIFFVTVFPSFFANPEAINDYVAYIQFGSIINLLFFILYLIDIARNRSFDFHKKLTWIVGIALFHFIVVTIYWYKHILRKNN